MKKIVPFVILFLAALMLWTGLGDHGHMSFDFDGEEIGGPVGALIGFALASGGVLIAAVLIFCVGAMLALLFAGLGVLLVSALAAAALLVAMLLSPFMLPFLVPLAIIWFFASRARRARVQPA